MSIVVLGSINLDMVVTTERMPAAGETISGHDFALVPGGKGANQAVAAARLNGEEVVFAGMVGTDSFASIMRESLSASGVKTNHLVSSAGSSGVALITVDAAGQNNIVVVPGANAGVDRKFVEERRTLLEQASVLLLQLEIPVSSVEFAAEIAFAAGVNVVLDPAPVCPMSATLLRNVTWLTPNFTEACQILGRSTVSTSQMDTAGMLDGLLELGSRNVLLKLGEYGLAVALGSGERFTIPAYNVSVVDTTAAGDALNGSFATGLAQGMTPFEAASFATAVAAISVTRRGAQTSMPHREEVESFLASEPICSAILGR